MQQVYFFAMFFGYGLCKSWAPMFSSFGFNPESGMPTLIGLLLFTSTIWAPVDKVISFLLTLNTRRNEFCWWGGKRQGTSTHEYLNFS